MERQSWRYGNIYRMGYVCCGILLLLAFLLDSPQNILRGIQIIFSIDDTLITDYFASAGVGAALLNAALILGVSVFLLQMSGDPPNGFTLAVLGLMSGFSLFGKNGLNSAPILVGGWFYARYQHQPFRRYVNSALLATCLSPVVSFLCHGGDWRGVLAGVVTGILIGFVVPPLSAYTFKLQNGMNLYNLGFASGLFGMILVAVLSAMGKVPKSAFYWYTGNNRLFAGLLALFCAGLILAGLFLCGNPPWAVWAGYRRLLRSTGRAPSDFLRVYGETATLVNMGVNGLLATAYILLIGGDLNGCTIGGIFTVIGFSGYGKHIRNVLPILGGLTLGGLLMNWSLTDPASQMAGMFCMTLAPISGYFGWPYGVLAGFLHSCLVLKTGGPVHGLNLYNNGFSGGIIAIVLYPVLTEVIRHRRIVLQDEDYFDIVEQDAPSLPPDESTSEG